MDAQALEILREIRDEARQTNARLDHTNTRLDQTNTRLDQVIMRLDGVESAIGELAEQQRFVVRYLKTLTERDDRLLDKVGDLEHRVERIEARLDPPSR